MLCKFWIKSFLIIVFFSLIAIFLLNINYREAYILIENNDIKLTYLKKMVKKVNLYINSCVTNILIDKKKYPLVKRPKISAIIPIYNGGNTFIIL